MKFSWSWLSQYVNLDNVTPQELGSLLSMSLAEVDSITYFEDKWAEILVCRVIAVKKHPNADRLNIVEIDINQKENKTVVTGADNFVAGDYLAYIPVGVRVPHNMYPKKFDGIIKKMKLRGVESEGMLASGKELEIASDHEGLLVLNDYLLSKDKDEYIGESFSKVFNLGDDYIFEIENKALTHRGDCFSIVGVAREVAAVLNKPLKELPFDLALQTFQDLNKKTSPKDLKVQVRSVTSCLRYSALKIENWHGRHTPFWMSVLLKRYGVSLVSPLVDLTNYIMLELGQPMHAFDLDKIKKVTKDKKTTMVVRRARQGEVIDTLDNKKHQLQESTAVIASQEHVMAIGGLIGGKDTAIDQKTNNIVLESATFENYKIRHSMMVHGIFTDAGTVFSRFQDPNKTVLAIARFVQLAADYQLGDFTIKHKIVDEYPKKVKNKTLRVKYSEILESIGQDLPAKKTASALKSLGLEVKDPTKNIWQIKVPTYRMDISIKEDVVEEVVRLFGYRNLQRDLPGRKMKMPQENKYWQDKTFISETLVSHGLFEVINFNFISQDIYEKSLLDVNSCFKITNAVSPKVQYVRSLITPVLLQKLSENLRYTDRVGLFEIGSVFRKGLTWKTLKNEPPWTYPTNKYHDKPNLPINGEHLSLALTSVDNKWDDHAYYLGKRYVQLLSKKLNTPPFEYLALHSLSKKAQKQIPSWLSDVNKILHPAKSAMVACMWEGKKYFVGAVGEVHPEALDKFGLPKFTVVSELSMPFLHQLKNGHSLSIQEPYKFPTVQQDFCFVVDNDLQYQSLVNVFEKNIKSPLISNYYPLDIYQDDKEQKQITMRVTLQKTTDTLTEKEIEKVRNKIIKTIEKKLKAKYK